MDGGSDDHLARIAASFTIHPDFPIKGVNFRNILPVMRDPQLFGWLIDECVARIKDKFSQPIDLVIGLEARGFLFGPAIALRLNCGFAPIRKPGKLPGKLATVSFKKEYGEDVFEIEEDAIMPGQRIVIVDDVLATGGTLRAATQLMEQRKALPVGTFVIVELLGLGGRNRVPSCEALFSFSG
ncbi:hypothetical protein RvY_07075 [Ramazzottius varieornatus]|uniref:Adenine phosphoribosyltransferase n=1 Tax=Ramazzottius varieornatus TaxID=947166 RepID=A0A1D1V9F3_RAMVA|nr:hypothetical protein RvY_07075 [Ramazzottius varieornatus]